MSTLKQQFTSLLALVFIALAVSSCSSHKVTKVETKQSPEQLVAQKLQNRNRMIKNFLRY